MCHSLSAGGAPVQCNAIPPVCNTCQYIPVQCNANPSSVHLQYLQYLPIYSSALQCIKAIHRSDIGATHGHTLCLYCIALLCSVHLWSSKQFTAHTAIRCVHIALVFCHHRRDRPSSLSNTRPHVGFILHCSVHWGSSRICHHRRDLQSSLSNALSSASWAAAATCAIRVLSSFQISSAAASPAVQCLH